MILETSFGHKAANLVKLDQLCRTFTLTGINVSVPPYLCFSHHDIYTHIQRHFPDYLKEWGTFVQMQKGQALFPSEARLHLWKMQEVLIQLFASHIFTTPALEEFLTEAKKKNTALVVRSTGREDSETFSNAGGNRSESGVCPTLATVSAAIGKVVASYHSVKSLRLRSFGEDDIEVPPFLSVFVQEMIGEVYECNHKLDIPVSGILHTQEMLGHTPGLIQLQALYGHNEALVKNLLPYDTFYISDQDIHAVVQFKKKRLVASLSGEFVSVDNPWEMRISSTLNVPVLNVFFELAQQIQAQFGQPIEVEWIYSDTQKTLYLVQARPLIENKETIPSYVNEDLLYQVGKEVHVYPLETIVSSGSVTSLVHQHEWIHDVTLEKGFNIYLRERREALKVVFCQIPAATTSHAACTLREQGIEVFSSSDLQIQELSKANRIGLVDPQQGKLFIFESIANLEDSGIIQQGWLSHPIPALETIPHELKKRKTSSKQGKAFEEKYVHHLLQAATTSNEAVHELLSCLNREVEKLQGQSVFFERGELIAQHAHKIASQYLLQEVPRMQRLHALKRLEALFFQHKQTQMIHSDSLQEILREHRSIFDLGKFMLQPTGQIAWNTFTEELLHHAPEVKRLEILISEIQRLHITEEWLNITFWNIWKNKGKKTAVEILTQLETEHKALFSLIHYLFDARKILQQWKERIPLWGFFKQFDSLYFDFSHHFLRELQEFTHLFFMTPAENWLGKAMLIHFIQESIEVYDQILKTLKASVDYPEKSLKVVRFKKMLEPFFGLMKIWVEQIPIKKIEEWIRTIESLGDKVPGDYRQTIINAIQKQLNQLTSPQEAQLFPSPEFNVSAQVISSAYFKNQSLPVTCTLEDLCTLIHQNILIAQMTHFTALWEGRLPQEIVPLHQALLHMQKQITLRPGVLVPIQTNWVGLSYTYPIITLLYNIPVKNHSTLIHTSYHLEEKSANVEVRMIGHNRGGRMESIAKNIYIQSLVNQYPFVSIPQYDKVLKMIEFSWKFFEEQLKDPQLLVGLQNILLKALEDTLFDHTTILVKPESLDNGQKKVWGHLGKEDRFKWFKAGAPYFQPLMQYFMAQGWQEEALKLLPESGSGDLSYNILQLIKNHPYYFGAYGNEQGFHGCNEVSEWVLKDFSTQAKPLLVEHRKDILYSPQATFANKMFFLALQFLILEALNKDQVQAYLEHLIEKKQFETVIDLYHNRKKWHFSTNQEQILHEASQGKSVDGFPVPAEIIAKAKSIMDITQLQKDHVIFVQIPRTSTWIQATVIKSSAMSSPEEPFGSIKVRISRGGILKITNPFNIKTLQFAEKK